MVTVTRAVIGFGLNNVGQASKYRRAGEGVGGGRGGEREGEGEGESERASERAKGKRERRAASERASEGKEREKGSERASERERLARVLADALVSSRIYPFPANVECLAGFVMIFILLGVAD